MSPSSLPSMKTTSTQGGISAPTPPSPRPTSPTAVETDPATSSPTIACGDGIIDAPGEECDPMADSTGCPDGQFCGETDCQCKGPLCGNGIVEDGEQCDYGVEPTGCEGGLFCESGCVCIAGPVDPPTLAPTPPEVTPSPSREPIPDDTANPIDGPTIGNGPAPTKPPSPDNTPEPTRELPPDEPYDTPPPSPPPVSVNEGGDNEMPV